MGWKREDGGVLRPGQGTVMASYVQVTAVMLYPSICKVSGEWTPEVL